MATFLCSGVSMDFAVRGDGEPLLLIHGGMIGSDSFEPIAGRLAESFQLITYSRRGYDGSPAHEECDMSTIGAEAVALLDHVGIARAHIGGHSLGAVAALQIALDAPARAHTLSLLEPLLFDVPAAAAFGAAFEPVAASFQSGDGAGALEGALTVVGGPDPVSRAGKALPEGWFERAVANMSALFSADFDAAGAWRFGADEGARISQPALLVRGSQTAPVYVESHELFKKWLPNAEARTIDGATHLLHWVQPDAVSAALLEFLTRHPMD